MTVGAAHRRERLAAIDIGTNCVLMTIVQRTREARLSSTHEIVIEKRSITRLGRGVDRTRQLEPQAVACTLDCLREYRDLLEQLDVKHVRCVGTSALRDAIGGKDFIAAAREILGTTPVVISGVEEGRLTFLGATADLGLEQKALVTCFDIGGGSTEIVSGQFPGHFLGGVSLDIGSVRLTERHVAHDPPTRAELSTLRRAVATQLATLPPAPRSDVVVGVAGTVTTYWAMANREATTAETKAHGKRLHLQDVKRSLKMLIDCSQHERQQIVGLNPGRADVIIAGGLLLQGLLEFFDIEGCLVSDRGVRHGLLQDWIKRETDETSAT